MSLHEAFEALSGQRIPGGCDDCDAYQTMTRRHGIYFVNVHHDDTCPTWRRIQAAREAEP